MEYHSGIGTHGKKGHVARDEGDDASRALRGIVNAAASAGHQGSRNEGFVPSVDDFAVEQDIIGCVEGDGEVVVCRGKTCKAEKAKKEEMGMHIYSRKSLNGANCGIRR